MINNQLISKVKIRNMRVTSDKSIKNVCHLPLNQNEFIF